MEWAVFPTSKLLIFEILLLLQFLRYHNPTWQEFLSTLYKENYFEFFLIFWFLPPQKIGQNIAVKFTQKIDFFDIF